MNIAFRQRRDSGGNNSDNDGGNGGGNGGGNSGGNGGGNGGGTTISFADVTRNKARDIL